MSLLLFNGFLGTLPAAPPQLPFGGHGVAMVTAGVFGRAGTPAFGIAGPGGATHTDPTAPSIVPGRGIKTDIL